MTPVREPNGSNEGMQVSKSREERDSASVPQLECRIAELIGTKAANSWLKSVARLEVVDRYLVVSAPNQAVGEWIAREFSDQIRQAARETCGRDLTLSFAFESGAVPDQGPERPAEAERIPRGFSRDGEVVGALTLRGRLEDFVVGSSNRLAHAAAVNVIEAPGQHFNPLFVYGGCGLGKTHLLQAICVEWSRRLPLFRWRYVTGEEFTNDYVCAVRSREMDSFHSLYRKVDALVIDDVHFLANKRATQEELLNTVKTIDTRGKQLVLASDAHPKIIGHFSESLVNRFVSGMVVRIESPDVDVRTEVLRRRAERLKAEVSDQVLCYVAKNFSSNIRELDGALLKIVAQAQVSGQPITLSLAERAVDDLIRQTAPVVLLSDIENLVAIYFGLAPAELHTSRKSRTIAVARGVAMYLARKRTDMSFPEIGRFMGNKNHSTVILACRRIARMLESNATVQWVTPDGMKEQELNIVVRDLEAHLGVDRRSNANVT